MSGAGSDQGKNPTVVGIFPGLLGFGGVQEASRQLVGALTGILERRGWHGTFLGLNDSAGLQTLSVEDQKIEFRGYDRAKFRLSFDAALLALKKPSIVIAAHPNLAPPARWMKRISRAMKTIVLCHGVDVWERLPPSRREALVRADLVLAPSTHTADKLVNVQGVSAERIRVLPWPVNAALMRMAERPSDLTLPARFPKGRVILTVGRWATSEQYKGADKLIEAMPELLRAFRGLQLVAVGSGDDLPRLKGIAERLKVSHAVHFLEGLSREELAACYAHSEIFALPSTGEGFGIVFLEAMAFGLPVVGVAAGGVTDIVQDGVNGLLVSGGDQPSLTAALQQLLQDATLRSRLGNNGAEMVRQKYQFTSFERGLEAILIGCGLDSVGSA
jgi:glycosyltransferase involved in cell wall biosynthesis